MKTIFVLLLVPFCFLAQVSDSSRLDVSAYVEMYYHFDVDDPGGFTQQPCFVSYAEKNGINANLALLQIKREENQTRGRLGIMTGNYAQYNLAAEPELLKHIYEASVGLKINKNIWLDVGIFPAHIGCESAIGPQNFNLSRSLIAENSPYFETGLRLSYDKGKKWSFALLALNGWQNIRETNKGKALGTLITYKPNSSLTINSCGFAGNEKADTAKQYRLFHDLNIIWQKSEKFSMILALDVGVQARNDSSFTSENWDAWHGGSFQLKFSPWKKVGFSVRAEEYWDENKVIIAPTAVNGNLQGFSARGGSFNIDVKPYRNIIWRNEFKYLNSENEIFLNSNGKKSNTEMSFISALMITF